MIIIQREVQHVYPDKWAELDAIDKEFNAVEAKLGFPPKKRYQLISGSDEMGTLIVEFQWPSLAAMETAYEKALADPERQALHQRLDTIIRDNRIELLIPLP